MKKLVYVLSHLSLSLSVLGLTVCKKANQAKDDLPEKPAIPAIETTVRDTGLYSGFPWPAAIPGGTIVTVWKESVSHADAGSLMLGKSSDGGVSWKIRPIVIQGSPIICTNFSFTIIPSGRLILSHKPDHFTSLYFAYSDDGGESWAPASGGFAYLAGYRSAPFSMPLRLPSGKLIQPFYSVPQTAGNPSIAGYIQSFDNGNTWSYGDTIAQHKPYSTHPSRYGITSEVCMAITDTGATDATTKIVAFLRNEEYKGWSHYKSSNGGISWSLDTTNVFEKFAPGSVAKFPVAMIKHNGLFYIFAGVRRLNDYHIAYVTCTPADLFNNNPSGYSAEVRVHNLNATTNGSEYDCGYPMPFHDHFHNLVLQWYDTSPKYSGVGPKQTIIYQKPIK